MQPLPDPQPGAATYGADPGPARQQPAGNRSPQSGGPHRVRNILAVIGDIRALRAAGESLNPALAWWCLLVPWAYL